jgi:hypothetical protein
MENCEEGKGVTNHVFPVSNIEIFYVGQVVMALYSIYINSKKLRRCCQGARGRRGIMFPAEKEAAVKERQVQYET